MITSKRPFGVEIEFVATNPRSYRNIASVLNVVEDGSLRPLQNAGEFVSPKISGANGEKLIRQACEILKKNGASGDNHQTSVHVHLDGGKGSGTLRSARRKPDVTSFVVAVSNKIKPEVSSSTINDIVLRRSLANLPQCNISDFGNVMYISRAQLTREPILGYTFYWLEKVDRFKWLQNTFYFYTLYSKVMESIVSNSRRDGNMYCIPLDKSFELADIESCKTEDEIKNVWYKNMPPNGHYDDSRYHNVNFHCYWDRHGTVEIRSHGGTVDINKILLWLKLHQKIVDKLEDIDLNEIKSTYNSENPYKSFVDFVEEPLLQNYVKRLLGYYSDITVE